MAACFGFPLSFWVAAAGRAARRTWRSSSSTRWRWTGSTPRYRRRRRRRGGADDGVTAAGARRQRSFAAVLSPASTRCSLLGFVAFDLAPGAGRARRAAAQLDRRHLPAARRWRCTPASASLCRTTDAAEYYVAGRRVPAIYNGMATAADWMSAASFIGLAGTLYLQGYGGLAYILGWTGGYCLVALLLAPYLRRFGQYTIPDFLGARYGGSAAAADRRWPPAIAGVLRLRGGADLRRRPDHSHLTGFGFEIGIFVGLGGVLVCSFLGGMRAVTWTQVAQYIVLIIAYLVPVVWLSVKQTGDAGAAAGLRPAAAAGGRARARSCSPTRREQRSDRAPARARAPTPRRKLARRARGAGRRRARAGARASTALQARERAAGADPARPSARLRALPRSEAAGARALPARARRRAGARPAAGRHAAARRSRSPATRRRRRASASATSRRNFLALVFCLMVGTAALPHVLMRYYTTPSVREARDSVAWSLFFILLLYLTAPALAVLVKYEVFNSARRHAVRPAAGLDRQLGARSTRSLLSVVRHQRRRHPAARRDAHRRRHHRAGHARDRRPAVRGLRPGRGRRAGGGAVDRRRPAADDRQRAVARRLLQA